MTLDTLIAMIGDVTPIVAVLLSVRLTRDRQTVTHRSAGCEEAEE